MSRLASVFGRSPGQISHPAGVRLVKQAAAVTVGQDQNRVTSSDYYRQIGRMILMKPFVLQAVLWDVNEDGTYALQFVTSLTDSTLLYAANASIALTGSHTENTIPVTPEIYLGPGIYYLSLYNATAVKWDDKGTATVYINDYLMFSNIGYDGGSYNYSIPIKLVGYPIDVIGLSNFVPPVAL